MPRILLLAPLACALPLCAQSSSSSSPSSGPVWKYEADLDLGGRSGNVDSGSLAGGIRAQGEREGFSRTTLALRGNRATQSGVRSADDLRAQAAHERTLAEKSFWYVRADAGYDNVRELDLVALGSAGFGHRFLKDERGSLDLRAGLGYRQEESSAGSPDVSAAALDAGLTFERDFGWSRLRIQVDATPSLEDLADLTLRHETSLEFLGKDSPLSLRIGLLQDYRSEAAAPDERLQNTYFLRLVYRWQ